MSMTTHEGSPSWRCECGYWDCEHDYNTLECPTSDLEAYSYKCGWFAATAYDIQDLPCTENLGTWSWS